SEGMMLMAHPRTPMWSGVLRAVASCGRVIPRVPRSFALGVLLTIIGALILKGCYLSRTVNQATASDVNNQSFTFDSGAVFHSALSNVSTALEFTNNATNFTLTSAGSISGTATGTSTVQSGTCTLTIASSTYTVGTKVRANSPAIKLSPCNFDSTTRKLTVTNAGVTATSEASTILS